MLNVFQRSATYIANEEPHQHSPLYTQMPPPTLDFSAAHIFDGKS
jgi:hypothetical protein